MYKRQLDPCFALQAAFEIAPGATAELAYLLGEADDPDHARRLIDRYRADGAAANALAEAQSAWRDWLGAVRIETPAPALDLMVNGWLAYQTLSCRIWGRSAFYQSGGAFGFRDQLQDAAALLYHDPELTRQQLLLNAAHQFQEGDVLHWWHPPVSYTHLDVYKRQAQSSRCSRTSPGSQWISAITSCNWSRKPKAPPDW